MADKLNLVGLQPAAPHVPLLTLQKLRTWKLKGSSYCFCQSQYSLEPARGFVCCILDAHKIRSQQLLANVDFQLPPVRVRPTCQLHTASLTTAIYLVLSHRTNLNVVPQVGRTCGAVGRIDPRPNEYPFPLMPRFCSSPCTPPRPCAFDDALRPASATHPQPPLATTGLIPSALVSIPA